MSTMREQFEAAAKQKGFFTNRVGPECDYTYADVRAAWWAWQAATEAAKATGTAGEIDADAEMAKVKRDVELMGVGFLVDGKRCSLDRITWFNRPGDTWLPPPPGYPTEAARQPAPVVAVKPWETRMQEYFAQGSVKMRTPASFMADEIIDWRATLAATAAPVTQPHYRMSEKPTAWLHTLPEGKFFNGAFSDNSQIIRDKDEADSECYFHGGTLTPLFTAEWTQASLDYVNEKADELHKKIVGSQP